MSVNPIHHNENEAAAPMEKNKYLNEMEQLLSEMGAKHDEMTPQEQAAYLRQKAKLALQDQARRTQKQSQLISSREELAGRLSKPGAAAESEETGPTDLEPAFEISSDEMMRMLCEQQGMDYVSLDDYDEKGDEEVLQFIPSTVAKTYKCLPLRIEKDGSLLVAIADPLNIQITDDLALLTSRRIRPVVAKESEINEYVEMYYGVGDSDLTQIMNEMQDDDTKGGIISNIQEMEIGDMEAMADAAPVIQLVNLLLMQAIKDRASDLHIEPFPNMLRIRYRVDGVLREIPSPPKALQLGIISRFKVLGGMNIAETRKPQDGRVKLTMEGREVDLRVSTLPTVQGESMAMRILDKSMMSIGITQLGMSKKTLERFRRLLKKPNGIILCTGPTGSGKTTTLYAAMAEINNPGDKIITTEDPVEYEMPGLVQVNINEKIGLTFERCLRAILRQDPDIILVGEIRDVQTAQIAVQSSLTGHLVFSTLHTNSSAATVTRLLDMGIEPFLLTSTLEGVIGQRLVRTICQQCKTPYIPTEEELAGYAMRREDVQDYTFSRGAGCDECAYTGFKGRIGLYELLEVNEEIRDLIMQREAQDVIHAAAVRNGMSTMHRDGFFKICMGMTTFNEVAAHTPQDSQESIELEMQNLLRRKKAAEQPQAPMIEDEEQKKTAPLSLESDISQPIIPPLESEKKIDAGNNGGNQRLLE